MKITIHTEPEAEEVEVTITCGRLTPEIEKVISMLKMLDQQLTAVKGGETFFLDIADILYIETVDKKTFLYTKKDVYETELKLYELEEQFDQSGFFRAGKSCIINIKNMKSLRSDLDRRIRVTMENGEQLLVSRQYAEALKKRLGVK